MKKVTFVLCAAVSAVLFAGCGSTKVARGNNDWWHNEVLAGKMASEIMGEPAIGGVGRSTLSGVTAEKAARTDARASLAQRIATTIADEVENSTSEEKGDEAKEAYSQDTKAIANQVLSGSAQIDYFLDKDGTTYVLMGLPLNGLDKRLQSAAMKTNNKEVRDFLNTLTTEQLKMMFNVN